MRRAFAVLLLLAPAVAAQTGSWTIAARPSSGGTAAYAAEAGHAATADAADTALTAATTGALAAEPAPCPAGQFASDLSAAGVLTCSAPPSGSGDVVGPASATDKGIPRYSGTTGKLLQDGAGVTISNAGGITTPFVTGAGNTGLRLQTAYNGGAKALSIYDSGNGETAYVDGNGSWYLSTSISVRDGVSGRITLAPSGGEAGISVGSGVQIKWSSLATPTGSYDTKLSRDAAGVVKVSDLLELTPLATAPACDSTAAGRIYHDTAPALCWCSGTAWVVVAGVGPCA